MLSGTFVAEIKDNNTIQLPSEVVKQLQLSDGEKVEVLIKRIKSRRLDIRISKNPLFKLLEVTEDDTIK
ncbi:MAG: hypothetical protein GF313_13215 [Caldithrix sp.]|nr:hypothetical protein [Caldithrix sp.]